MTLLRTNQSISSLPVGAGMPPLLAPTTKASELCNDLVKSHFGLMPDPVTGFVIKKWSPSTKKSSPSSGGTLWELWILFHASMARSWIWPKRGVPTRQEMSNNVATAPTFLKIGSLQYEGGH